MNKAPLLWLVLGLAIVVSYGCHQGESANGKESVQTTVQSTLPLTEIEDTPTTGKASDVTVIIGYGFDPGDPRQPITDETLQDARTIVQQAAQEGALWLDADTGITNFTDAILNDPAISYYPLAQAIIAEAHQDGMQVFFYFSTTELETPDAVNRTEPTVEELHPDWVQVDQNGKALVFQAGDLDLFWLEEGSADVRLNPLAEGWREELFRRAEALARMGADGIFLDVPYFFTIDDRWADFSPASAAAFQAATGLQLPDGLSQDGTTYYKWLVWRHTIWQDFFRELKGRIQAVNPDTLLIVEEFPGANPIGAIETGLDPAALGSSVDVIAHEYDHLQEEGGAAAYGLEDWQHTRDVYKWYQDMGTTNWSLCYASHPADSKALAAITFAHQLSFWETKAPNMVDDSTGEAWRKQLLEWVRLHAALLDGYSPAAQVALVYSSQTRDLTNGSAMDDLVNAQHALDQAGIPYIILTEANIEKIDDFPIIIFPNTVYTTPAVASAVEQYKGEALATGNALTQDAWGENSLTLPVEHVTLAEAIARIQTVPFHISGGENLFADMFRKGQAIQLRLFNADLNGKFQAATQSITIQFQSRSPTPSVTQLDFLADDTNALPVENVGGAYQVQVEVGLMTILTIEP